MTIRTASRILEKGHIHTKTCTYTCASTILDTHGHVMYSEHEDVYFIVHVYVLYLNSLELISLNSTTINTEKGIYRYRERNVGHEQTYCTHTPPESSTTSSQKMFHPILRKVNVEAIEESSQQSSNCSHQHEDNQVIGVPQLRLIL